MRPLIPFLFILSSSILIQNYLVGQCPVVGYGISQKTIDSLPEFYPNCNVWEGNMILGSSITDLSGLINIHEIKGQLSITSTSLSNLDGLNSLVEVGKNLGPTNPAFQLSAPNLVDVSGLDNLKTVHTTFAIRNSGIIELVGFNSLESSLNIEIRNNDQLISIQGFDMLIETEGEVGIYNNDNLDSIGGFNSLKKTDGVYIKGDNLKSISGFNSLVDIVDRLNITDAPHLLKIDAFQSLERVMDDFSLRKLNNLVSLNGFNKLEYVEDGFTFGQLENLVSIEGFAALDNLWDLNIWGCSSLSDVKAFENLKTIRNDIYFIDNDGMINLNFLPNLESIASNFYIEDNDKLQVVTNLDHLNHVGDGFYIRNNSMFTGCETLCPIIKRLGEDWGEALENGMPCEDTEAINSVCNDTISDIKVFDIHLNLQSGTHTRALLDGALLELYEEDELIESLISDEDGIAQFNIKELDEDLTYRLDVYHPDNDEVTIRHFLSLDALESDPEVEFPRSLYEDISNLRDSLKSRQIKVSHLGGAYEWAYPMERYDLSFIDLSFFEWQLIDEDHELIFEKMKRMGMGLNALNTYLDFAIFYAQKLGKALIDGSWNLYELIKITNGAEGLKEAVDNFHEEQIKQGNLTLNSRTIAAQRTAMKSISSSLFKLFKTYKIEPWLASYGNSPEDIAFVKNIKFIVTLIENQLAKGGTIELIKSEFWNAIYNGVAYYLIENMYVEMATQDYVNVLALKVDEVNVNFEELIDWINYYINLSTYENERINAATDFWEGTATGINSMSENLATLANAIAITSLGSLAPLAGSLHAVSKLYKGTQIGLSTATMLGYGYRFVQLPGELNKAIVQPDFRQFRSGEAYPEMYLSDLLKDFEEAYFGWEVLIDEWKNALTNGTSEECASRYMDAKSYFELNVQPNHSILHHTLMNMAEQANVAGEVDTIYFNAIQASNKIQIYRTVLELEMLAYLSDTSDIMIKEEFALELDTLMFLDEGLISNGELLVNEYGDSEFLDLIVLSDIVYPDSLADNFSCTFSIENVGPVSSPSFSMTIAPNENMDIQVFHEGVQIDTLIDGLELTLGEKMEFEVVITPKELNKFLQLNVSFEEVRAIDQSIPFSFINQSFTENPSFNNEVSISNPAFYFYPNPTKDRLCVADEIFIENLRMYNILGQLVFQTFQFVKEIDCSSFQPGNYILQFESNGKTVTQKISILK